MGNAGSLTAKANINSNLFTFTTWDTNEMNEFLHRGQRELSEVFGLRKHEFEFLLGAELIDFTTSRALFNEVFDTDKNQLVDKFEVMCIIGLTSKLSNQNKIHFFFDLFNFNDKGYLFESEVTLLLLAITRGAYKVDQKYIPPSAKMITKLVSEAMSYAKVNALSLRKPELVEFVLGNPTILAFLETWRGHASQILLGRNTQWRDLSFPCNESAIIPNHHWLGEGLPPAHFVRWRRKDKVGISGLGCGYLFTHTLSFLKTVDRRIVYEGHGTIGNGSLKQGLLADRWLLNAMAAMVARPDTISACFAATGQESAGRHCVRFYEGTGWRTVYVDDRLPCSPDRAPLFASSSNSLECWPLILEKAMAKYLGSYGALAKCSVRSDATLTALRYLTGGHILRYFTKYYEWCSVEDEVTDGENASVRIKEWMAEGSMVSFGRSESLALMNRKSSATKGNAGAFYVTPPHGRLFPVLGSVYVKGYQYFILRDAWGVIADADRGVNFDTGHSNTFQIRTEDIPYLYDSMIVVKHPDSLRAKAAAANSGAGVAGSGGGAGGGAGASSTGDRTKSLKPWVTGVFSNSTNGVSDPARFVVTVPHNITDDGPADPDSDLYSKAPVFRKNSTVQEVLEEMDNAREAVLGMDSAAGSAIKVVKLKDKVDFSRKQGRMSTAGLAKTTKVAGPEGGKESSGDGGVSGVGGGGGGLPPLPAKENFVEKLAAIQNALVDLSFTVSSSCDWSFAGSKEAGAKIRVRLTPTKVTFRALLERERRMVEIRARAQEMMEMRRIAQAKLLEIETATINGTAVVNGGDNHNSNKSQQISDGDSNSVHSKASSTIVAASMSGASGGGASGVAAAVPASESKSTTEPGSTRTSARGIGPSENALSSKRGSKVDGVSSGNTQQQQQQRISQRSKHSRGHTRSNSDGSKHGSQPSNNSNNGNNKNDSNNNSDANSQSSNYATIRAPPKPPVIFTLPKADDKSLLLLNINSEYDNIEDAYHARVQQFERQFDCILSGERSWISHSMKLLPGEYYLFADVSYDTAYEHAFRMTLPLDRTEAPWLHTSAIVKDTTNPLGTGTSTHNSSSMFNNITDNNNNYNSAPGSSGNSVTNNNNSNNNRSSGSPANRVPFGRNNNSNNNNNNNSGNNSGNNIGNNIVSAISGRTIKQQVTHNHHNNSSSNNNTNHNNNNNSSAKTLLTSSPSKLNAMSLPSISTAGDGTAGAAAGAGATAQDIHSSTERGRDAGVDPALFTTHTIHVQMSSYEKISVLPVEKSFFPPDYDANLEFISVSEEKWPFMTEAQSDVASRELVHMLSRLKMDAETTGLEFMTLTNRYKESRKEGLVRQTILKRNNMTVLQPREQQQEQSQQVPMPLLPE